MNIFSRHSHREIDNKIFIGSIAVVWQLRMSLKDGVERNWEGNLYSRSDYSAEW